jgi:hypothetical protein
VPLERGIYRRGRVKNLGTAGREQGSLLQVDQNIEEPSISSSVVFTRFGMKSPVII